MRAVIQRVAQAQVYVDNQIVGQIGQGLWILLGVGAKDNEAHAAQLVEKITRLRIFPDVQSKMNLSLADVGGEALVVSQFTLYADCRRGNRPSFTEAAQPAAAERLYRYFSQLLRDKGVRVANGQFGAEMHIAVISHGPVTINLDV